jgi:hypothetical protein
MKPGRLVAGAAFAILFAGCAVEHDSGKPQTGLAQSDVSRYVAEKPLFHRPRCGWSIEAVTAASIFWPSAKGRV